MVYWLAANGLFSVSMHACCSCRSLRSCLRWQHSAWCQVRTVMPFQAGAPSFMSCECNWIFDDLTVQQWLLIAFLCTKAFSMQAGLNWLCRSKDKVITRTLKGRMDWLNSLPLRWWCCLTRHYCKLTWHCAIPGHHLAYDVKLCHRWSYCTSPLLCVHDAMHFISYNC